MFYIMWLGYDIFPHGMKQKSLQRKRLCFLGGFMWAVLGKPLAWRAPYFEVKRSIKMSLALVGG